MWLNNMILLGDMKKKIRDRKSLLKIFICPLLSDLVECLSFSFDNSLRHSIQHITVQEITTCNFATNFLKKKKKRLIKHKCFIYLFFRLI